MRDEKEIIQTVIDGDAEAFAELVRAHQSRLRIACLVWLGNRDEANDAAQEVFLKAFKALDTFKGTASFLTWLLRIADNYCRDILRTRKTRRTDSLDALLAEKGDALERLLSRAGTLGDVPYAPQDFELLGRLFAALPEDDREILILSEIEELAYKDISDRLHCSLDAVKGRLKRARQNLIHKCGHYFFDTSSTLPRLKE